MTYVMMKKVASMAIPIQEAAIAGGVVMTVAVIVATAVVLLVQVVAAVVAIDKDSL
jgi:hypothetical protein